MGWFKNLLPWTWDDDRPSQSARNSAPSPAQSRYGPAGTPTRERAASPPSSGLAPGSSKYGAQRTPPPANAGWTPLQPRLDYREASAPTRRYLEATRSVDPYENDRPALPEFELDQATLQPFGDAHSYELTPWQMKQAEYDYGIRAPEKSPILTGERYNTAQVTQEAWDRMSPQQQNALRFNSELTRAVELDRSLQGQEVSDSYRNQVSEMFGTQGGSDMYAPNTLALLQGMDMGRLRGQDLDEYLSLDRAYTSQEIAGLQTWQDTPEVPGYTGFGEARSQAQADILDRVQIDKAGQLIENALADPDIYGWDDQSRIDQYLGRAPDPAAVPIGWLFGDETPGDSRTDADSQNREFFFQAAYDYLSSDTAAEEPGGLDFMWQQGDDNQFTDADYEELFDYFYLRSLEDDRVGVGEGRRSGADIRAILGMGD